MSKERKIISTYFDSPDSHTLAFYRAHGGYSALETAINSTPENVVENVKNAQLQGRGGAGFPAGNKWSFLPKNVFPRYLVINGDESEPGTYKDRVILEKDPHLVVEGALIAAYAVRADQIFIYVRGEMPFAHERLIAAVNEAYENHYCGKRILGRAWGVDITVHTGAGAYIVGEETALIESLEGNRGMPRIKPPFFPAAKGLYMCPTIVNNVETIANIPYIVSNSGSKYASIGGENAKGTRLFAVSGHVRNPGVFEVELGVTTFRDLIMGDAFGQGIANGNKLKAFIPGGASAPWFFEEHLDVALSAKEVADAGSMLGSGAVVVMDSTTDAVRATWRIVKFFSHESCGKCVPCREGTSWLEKVLARILAGNGSVKDLNLLREISATISPGLQWPPRQTTICPLGPSAVSPVVSSLERFENEYLAYVKGEAS